MKALFLSKHSVSYGYGGERWLFEVCSRLSKSNSVTLVTGSSEQVRTDFKDRLVNDFKIDLIELQDTHGAFANSSKEDSARLKELLESSQVTYVMDLPIRKSVFRSLLKQCKETKSIRGHHTPLSVAQSSVGPNFAVQNYYRHVKPLLLRSSGDYDAHHVLTATDKSELMRWSQKPVFHIQNGISYQTYRAGEKADHPTFCFLGRLDKHKGFDRLPQVIDAVSHQVPGAQFTVVGEGPMVSAAKRLESSYHNVHYYGYVEEELKQKLMRSSHFLLLLSRWEAFPFTALESMASGTPVMTFDIPGPTELIQNGIDGIVVSDLGEMIRKIIVWSKWITTDAYGELCRKSRERTALNDWQVIIRQLEQMMEQVSAN